jgi:dTDP-4-amino-4,6-dideoxy-D-galactose acyltransferase
MNGVRVLDWDSAFFGLRIASLAAEVRSEDDLQAALQWCQAERVACLYVLSESHELNKRAWLTRHGALEVDVRTTLSTSAPVSPAIDSQELSQVRAAAPEDLPALATIARTAHGDSRFWNDPHFAREHCAELYATWIRKAVQGQADAVFVATLGAQAVGYISCHARGVGPDAHAEIGLVAVAEAARGQGLGGALVRAALLWAQARGLTRTSVVTQGRNAAALRLYATHSFVVQRQQVWQHLWLSHEPQQS